MQYSFALLSLLAATSTLAAPTKRTTGNADIEVRLQAESFFLHVPMPNTDVQKLAKTIGARFQDVKFRTIEVLAGGQPKPRCQILGQDGNAIIADRGANKDTTFSDSGNGLWTFQDGPAGLSAVICDPAFEADNLNDVVNNAVPDSVQASASAATVTATASATAATDSATTL